MRQLYLPQTGWFNYWIVSMSQSHKQYGFKIHSVEKSNELHFEFYMDPPELRVLSFKGGGVRVVVYRKFLEIAQQNGTLATIKEIGGSSSGTFVAAFAALHYDDPKKRTEALEFINQSNVQDIMGTSRAWKAYQVISSPLYIASKPLEWTANAINWVAKQCNKVSIGKLIGYPLTLVSALISAASMITSPRGAAGLFNLLWSGGIYRGDLLQQRTRDRIQQDTQLALNSILSKITDNNKIAEIQKNLVKIGLCQIQHRKLIVLPDITFNHLYEISLLPRSQFKEFYTTAVRTKDKKLVVFNKVNTPDMTIHLATRLAMSFPKVYKPGLFQGDEYFDGGAIDNSPVRLATTKPVTEFQLKHDITDNLARLNIRVEYPDHYQQYLWHKAQPRSRFNQVLFELKSYFYQLFTVGIDSVEHEAESAASMRKDFAQRTLQMQDFGIARLDYNLNAVKRHELSEKSGDQVNQYFDLHRNEKAIIKHYRQPKAESIADEKHSPHDTMPMDIQIKLLEFLENHQAFPTQDIFCMPGKKLDELEMIRRNEISRFKQLPSIKAYLIHKEKLSTTIVMSRTSDTNSQMMIKPESSLLDIKVETPTVTIATVNQTQCSPPAMPSPR